MIRYSYSGPTLGKESNSVTKSLVQEGYPSSVLDVVDDRVVAESFLQLENSRSSGIFYHFLNLDKTLLGLDVHESCVNQELSLSVLVIVLIFSFVDNLG